MKILTSYFYQIRFFKPYLVPLSTAAFDPKWFHNNLGHSYAYKDKNDVLNGLRINPFVPRLFEGDGECRGPVGCTQEKGNCGFLRCYYNQLNELNFEDIKSRFESLSERIKKGEGLDRDPIFVLIFHEKPDNPCSERWPAQRWLREHGVEVEEFDKEKL